MAWRRAGRSQRAIGIALVAAAAAYVAAWLAGSQEWLLDPLLQNDDARGNLFVFHPNGPALGAPAADVLALLPPGVRLLYRVLSPLLGVLVAAKVVQALALVLGLAPAWLTARRCGGLAVGFLLLLLVLHDGYAINRMAGGLPRAFLVPLVLLHATGLLDRSFARRAVACVLAALLYPPALLLALATEACSFVADGVDLRRRGPRLRFVRLSGLAVLTVGLVALLFRPGAAGAVPDLEQARASGGFGPGARRPDLPLADAIGTVGWHAALHLVPDPATTETWPTVEWSRRQGSSVALAGWAALALLAVARLTAAPRRVVLVFIGGAFIHLLATWLAFRLYVPERYLAATGSAGGALMIAAVVGLVAPDRARHRRALVRGVAALGFAAWLVAFTGLGAAGRNGMTVDARGLGGLVAALRALPPEALVASHPGDGDHAPFWAQRASFVGLETMQPWHLTAWERSLARGREVLDALYATDRAVPLAFARRHGVTHFLLRRDRHRVLPERALLFEPLGSHVRTLVGEAESRRFVLADVPAGAIAWQDETWILVDAARLERAWSRP